jgi:UDP-N-acetylmuramyl pentapeptide synthase
MMAAMTPSLPGSIDHYTADTPDMALAALRTALRDGDRVFIKGSNGSGACRVAAMIIDGVVAPSGVNGGASHAA